MNPGQHNFKSFANNYTIAELSRITGAHASTISGYRTGGTIPSNFLILIADHFKVSTDRVLGRVIPAEALTEENFPTARPNVEYTITEELLTHKQQIATLKKRIRELEAELQQPEPEPEKTNDAELANLAQYYDKQIRKLSARLQAINLLSEEEK